MTVSLPPGVVLIPGKKPQIGTISLILGQTQFDEVILKKPSGNIRVFDPTRSKLAAAITKGAGDVGIHAKDVVLYLGASHGYTTSFVSDMVGVQGFVFAIDIAPRVVRDLVFVAKERPNIAPILADCAHPESYCHRVSEVDWIFQDIAQKDQAGIFVKNITWFLKDKGMACLAVKARSVDVSKSPQAIYAKVRQELEKHVEIVNFLELDPLQKDHGFFIIKKV